MTCLLDTSAVYALLDDLDNNHHTAADAWAELLANECDIVMTSYGMLETFALVQNRLGLEAVRDLDGNLMPLVRVSWVDRALHEASVSALLAAGRRKLSLVDCVSFEFMRRSGIKSAFVFDDDFGEQGFDCLP